MIKQCSKCKQLLPQSCFSKRASALDGLHYWCKNCCRKYRNSFAGKIGHKKYRKSLAGKISKKRCYERYSNTIRGHLNTIFQSIKQRCNNFTGKNKCYVGVKCLFKSSDEFADYVVNELQVDPRGLVIDRIDNNKNYESGNIRFVSWPESNKNRRKWSKK